MDKSPSVGDKVRVEGISLRGKNRVREHGEIWTVTKDVNGDLLVRCECSHTRSSTEPWLRCWLRWIFKATDHDFRVTEVIKA